MFIKKELSAEQVLLKISLPLDGETATTFQEYLDELLAGPHKIITFDLSEVKAINSSSLGKILLFRQKLTNQVRTFQIRGCSDQLYSVFKLILFDRIIDIKKERTITI